MERCEAGVQHQKCGTQGSLEQPNTGVARSFKLELRERSGQDMENLEVSGHLGDRTVENRERGNSIWC